MTFEQLQKTWQSQPSGFNLSIDSDLLLREVKRNKEHFERVVFWRDVREGGGSFLMFIFFLYLGLKDNIWPLFLLAVLVLFIGCFIVTDRIVQRKRHPVSVDSLVGCVETSLSQIEHQIWLLKNVFWWYLLPLSIGIAIFVSYIYWKLHVFSPIPWISCGFFYLFIYHLNQYVVRKELSPRKQELEQLLSSLKS